MTLITDHPYEHGPFGRCAHAGCNKRKPAHGEARITGDFPDPDLAEPAGTAIFLKRRGREETRLPWPADWPLPRSGQVVHLGPGEEVIITVITFDVDHGRIILHSK